VFMRLADAHMEISTSPSDQLTEREIEILERLSDGLSDQQIADMLCLSLNTVKWYNRQIYSKLRVGSRTQAIAYVKDSSLLEVGVGSGRPASNRNLPAQSTPFIGRSHEITDVKHLLRSSALLTLTGSGGTGKTRLALSVAGEAADSFADGVCFVDLAPLTDYTQVTPAIAGALGVFENSAEALIETLKRVLSQRELLLLIDNFEHVIEAAPLVAELLATSPRLKVLVTSRESLRLSAEQEYAVPPLSLPLADGLSVKSLTESEAGALFIQRARLTQPHFEARDDNAAAIGQICIRLDGLPLAIELAAARCKLLTPQALLERLEGARGDSALQVLTSGSRDAPPRQRTLRDSIEWSYNLLDQDEKILLARLAVFRGGRSLEAIEAICGADLSMDVFDGLASLVDKSLVRQKETAGGEPRFVLLEMIREYARERLAASGEMDMMRRRHAAYFVALAERAEPELRLAGYDSWCQRFDLELDNLRAALEWSLGDGDVVLGVRLAGALAMFWYGKGHHVEGFRWTQQLLERLDAVPTIHHAKFLISAGHMTMLRDLEAAQPLFISALDISRELGDPIQIAWALIFLAYTRHREPEAAMPLVEEGLAMFRELNHQPGIAQALNIIGEIMRVSGDQSRARQVYEECLAISQQTGERRRIGYTWQNLAYLARQERDYERALGLAYQTLRLVYPLKSGVDLASTLETIAGALSGLGQAERAARLLGAAESANERLGAFHHLSNQPEIDRTNAEVRAQLDDATFQAAWAEGRTMTLEQAVASVLDGNEASLSDELPS
jgi:non-specific serine/threonine protein kinase